MSIQIPCPFLNQIVILLLSCMSSLYILDSSPLSDIRFANIFSHSVGCLLSLLMVSFAMQKCFSLMWSPLFIFALLPLFLVSDSHSISCLCFSLCAEFILFLSQQSFSHIGENTPTTSYWYMHLIVSATLCVSSLKVPEKGSNWSV